MDAIRQDIRDAVRRLIKNPGFTLVALLTLALGIGANTAIFSVVNGVLLEPLPYSQPEQIVGIYHLSEGRRATMSGPNFTDVKKLNTTLQDAAAYTRRRAILTGQGEPIRLDGAEISASLFGLLGVPAMLGRTFREEENQPGRNHVAILSHDLWQQRYGGDRAVIGRRMLLDGVSHEIVGVMPPNFSFPAARAVWTPLEYTEEFTTSQRGAWYLQAVGRAKTGLTPEQVRAEIETLGRQLAQQYPDSNEGVDIIAMPLHDAMVGDLRGAFWILLGAVGFVLLIACVNVANLLLARAASRESEIALRTALGASRARLVRQLLTESVILGLIGGALGLLLAVWGVEALITLEPQGIPRLNEVSVDPMVVQFTMALALMTGLLFGIFPAFQSTRGEISGTLKEGGRGALTIRGGARMRTTLVVAEVALAVTLLAGAGLLKQYFPGEDPIGKTIRLGWGRGGLNVRAGGEVVGILGDVKDAGLNEPEPPQIYLPYRQWPVPSMSVVMSASIPPASAAEPARRAVYSIDPNLPVSNVRTLEQLVSRSISQPRFYMMLLTLFGAVALVLAAIGIFGVLSYAVAQRTREIGIRMALGAHHGSVLRLIVREAMLMTLGGVVIGLGAAFLLSEWLVSQLLFETSPHDPFTFALVAAVLTAAALLAAHVPARRATRVDPIVALRGD